MARMAINPGIPIPSAIPRVSTLERLFNEADGVDEAGDCMVDVGSGSQLVSEWVWGTETTTMVDSVICEDDVVVADDIIDEDVTLVENVVVGGACANNVVAKNVANTTAASMVRREGNKDDQGPTRNSKAKILPCYAC